MRDLLNLKPAWLFILLFVLLGSIYIDAALGRPIPRSGLALHALELVVMTVAWGFVALLLAISRRLRLAIPAYLVPLLLLILWSAAGMLFGPDPQLGLRSVFQLALLFLIQLVFANRTTNEAQFVLIGRLLLIVVAANTVVAFAQAFNPTNPEFTYAGIPRSQGLTGSGNGLAFLALFAVAILYPLALVRGRLWWSGVAMSAVCIVLTQTRAGLALFLLVLILGYKVTLRPRLTIRHLQAMLVVVAVVAVVAFLISLMPDSYYARVMPLLAADGLDTIGTLSHRITSWALIYTTIVKQNPLTGAGAGASETLLRGLSEGEALDAVHNEYLRILADTGAIGLLLYVAWVALLYRHIIRAIGPLIREGRNQLGFSVAYAAATLVFVVLLIGSAAHNLIYAHEITAAGMIVLGAAISYLKTVRTSVANQRANRSEGL